MLDGESEIVKRLVDTAIIYCTKSARSHFRAHRQCVHTAHIIVIAFLCTAKRLMCCFARRCIDKITHLAKCARQSPQPLTSKSLYEQELVFAAVTADDEQLTFSFLLLFVWVYFRFTILQCEMFLFFYFNAARQRRLRTHIHSHSLFCAETQQMRI